MPQAIGIIQEIKDDFFSWVETRKFAPTVNALKTKLKKISKKS